MKNTHLLLILVIISIISLNIGIMDTGGPSILDKLIFFESRLPRLMSLLISGMSISIAGLIMQQITQNKFTSPTTSGTMDWAKLGILISLIFFKEISSLYSMIFSFTLALLGSFLFMRILKAIKFKNSILIPIIGISLGKIVDGFSSFLAYKYDLVQSVSTWLEGDFSMIIKGRYELLYISLPLLIISYLYASKFTVVGMGEEFSTNLGLNHKQIVSLGLIIVSLISSLVIVTVGRIPFLGLVVPNLVSIFKGDNMENSIISTGLLGSILLLTSDIIGRLIIYPYEVSISLIVGVLGSLAFLYLIVRSEIYDK